MPTETLQISRAYFVAPAGDAPAAMYFSVRNQGPGGDTLTGVRVNGVTKAELHTEVMSQTSPAAPSAAPMQMATMVATPAVPIPPNTLLRLAPGGRHVMLTGLHRHFVRGDTTSADLMFTRVGSVHVPVVVIDYTQLDTLVHLADPLR